MRGTLLISVLLLATQALAVESPAPKPTAPPDFTCPTSIAANLAQRGETKDWSFTAGGEGGRAMLNARGSFVDASNQMTCCYIVEGAPNRSPMGCLSRPFPKGKNCRAVPAGGFLCH